MWIIWSELATFYLPWEWRPSGLEGLMTSAVLPSLRRTAQKASQTRRIFTWKIQDQDLYYDFYHLYSVLHGRQRNVYRFRRLQYELKVWSLLNQLRCNSQSTDKQLIAISLTIRSLIGFITYDRIDVIKTAVTSSVYLNLCAYHVQCSSATRHTYLIELQRYYNCS